MPIENTIQDIVHKLEEGGWVKWVQLAVLVAAVVFVVNLWFFRDNGFKGLAHEKAMEQAQIAREIARGNGFSTKMIRPAALWQFQGLKGDFPLEKTPDTYHAPVWPTVLAPFLWLAKDTWKMTRKDIVYTNDRIVAAVATFFFLLAVGVNYFIARRLFDNRLAVMSAGLLLLCDQFWQFSMSGLPQMLMLFLFSLAIYTLLRAVEAHQTLHPLAGEPGMDPPLSPGMIEEAPPAGTRWHRYPLPWLIATAVLCGTLALTHALTIWIFIGVLLFVISYFTPRGRSAAIMLAIFVVMYAPWMIRNHQVCGNPLGLGWYSGLYQIRGTESQVMRTRALEGPLKGVSPTVFREKVQNQIIGQVGNINQNFGSLLVAPLFFLALMHLFRRRITAVFRWAVLLIWTVAVLGMAIFGLQGRGLDANDLHVLFIPVMTFYGLAFVLVLWSRLEVEIRLIRIAFIVLVFLLCSMPFANTFLKLLDTPDTRVMWPPYVPPSIAALGDMVTEREVIVSDMPWAVAWYADRKSLWLPMTIKDFIDLNDYNRLQTRMVGLYLTPVSGDRPFIREILTGEYKAWAPFITRSANVRNFPLRAVTAMEIDGECVFYADRDRWSARDD